MLFEPRLQKGLSDGTIRVAYRRWRRPQVVAGRRYRSPIGMVEVHAISSVEGEISEDDARSAGYASVASLLRDLKGPPDAAIYRLELSRSLEADARSVLRDQAALSAEDLAVIQKRLERLDAARGRPWTMQTLKAIQAQPGRRAGDLAPELGWSELQDFKLHVRKLKALGLTVSLPVGYELSARGTALLQQIPA